MTAKAYPTEVHTIGNAAFQLEVRLPSGRLTLVDKVSKVRWAMGGRDSGCGRVALRTPQGGQSLFYLGRRGRRGTLFSMVDRRFHSGREDDYEGLSIEALLGTDEDEGAEPSRLRIEFLVSKAFPTLGFSLSMEGPLRSEVEYLAYPQGFAVDTDGSGRIVVPSKSALIASANPERLADELERWRPVPGKVTTGASVFAIAGDDGGQRQSALIGSLENPTMELETSIDDDRGVATPILHNPGGPLADWSVPFGFKYTVLPNATDEAIAWMLQETEWDRLAAE